MAATPCQRRREISEGKGEKEVERENEWRGEGRERREKRRRGEEEKRRGEGERVCEYFDDLCDAPRHVAPQCG
jgi:hypothetical protein